MREAGRNDPCPCGSGKKYKQCCRLKEVVTAPQQWLPAKEGAAVEPLTHFEINQLVALFNSRRFEEMESAASAHLARYPHSGFAWKALGTALLEQGKDAVSPLQSAAALLADDADCFNNLGKALLARGRTNEAVASYLRALAVKPDYAEANCGLGGAWLALGKLDEAVASCRLAVERDPNYAMGFNNLGNALSDCNLRDEAIVNYRRALQIDPGFAMAYGNLLMALQFVPEITRPELFRAHLGFGEQFEAPFKPLWIAHANSCDANKRLKIGYVSGDFREHAVTYFIEPVLANHDNSQVEVFCYSNSLKHDAFTERLIAESDHWQPCVGMTDDQLAQRIRDDGIDILVDLSGHTANNRLLTFARKPAPIQITYLGYPGSSGLSAMDYRLTDSYAEPDGDQYYTEKLLRLPDSMWCYRPGDNMPEVTPLPALANGYLTFGSFNNVNKIGPECIALWAELLRKIPASRLLMATVPEGEMRLRLNRQFAELGVASDRITFCGRLPTQEFKCKLQEADITLDPFPVNGATTTCESLWLGVPVLTLVGQRFLSRAGLSVLSAARLPEFAAATPEDYINTAMSLANDLPRLAAIRAGMRERLIATPLFDQKRFTRNLERIYRDVWREYAARNRPPENSETKGLPASKEIPKAEVLTPAAMNQLIALFRSGNFAALEMATQAIFERDPSCGFAWQILGAALEMQGKDGLHALKMAAQFLPDDAGAHSNLGKALRDHERFDESVASYRSALTLKPNFAVAYNGLGMTMRRLGRIDEAVANYHQALILEPGLAEAYSNMGRALLDICRYGDAILNFRRALEIKPDYAEVHDNLLMSLQCAPGVAQADIFLAHRQFGERFEASVKSQWLAYSNLRDAEKKLKIGYVSGDFRRHPVAYFIEPVLCSHDKAQVEVFCYSNHSARDAFTDRLIAAADHWQPCVGLTDDQLARRIRADGIDILVDLSGHTARNRLLTFARKPAPIQITYLGYPGSSGLSAMDYRLTDSYTEPGSDQYYTEKLLRLPGSLWCYRPAADMPEVTPLPALANGYLTFGSFNNVIKVGSECIALWAALLRSLPTSRLLMVTVPEGEIRTRLTGHFAQLGVAADRITYCGALPSQEFQRKLQEVDIALDPFPVNGATTTCESLWLGVPVLTLVGERFLSRAGLSVLSAAHLPEFAAATPAEFLKIAAALAGDLPRLAEIRTGLRERLKTTPLFDQRSFTRNLERIYRDVWRIYVSSIVL